MAPGGTPLLVCLRRLWPSPSTLSTIPPPSPTPARPGRGASQLAFRSCRSNLVPAAGHQFSIDAAVSGLGAAGLAPDYATNATRSPSTPARSSRTPCASRTSTAARTASGRSSTVTAMKFPAWVSPPRRFRPSARAPWASGQHESVSGAWTAPSASPPRHLDTRARPPHAR